MRSGTPPPLPRACDPCYFQRWPRDNSYGRFATGRNERWAQANRYRSEYTYDANGNIETVERYDADGTGHYDSFAYHYHTIGGRKQQNRLYELIDDATMSTGSDIVTTATGFDNTSNGVNVNNNYGYDALGNLVRDDREEIELIHWTVAGKVDSIQRPGASSRSPLKFRYGASGQRVSKQVGDFYCTEPGSYREHYIRDAQGNIMATYRYTNTAAASLKLHERPLYGSSRLGSLRTELELRSLPSFDPTNANPVQQVDLNYELTDHLGNVCAVVTGRLLDGNGGGTPKQAELVSAQGYEAFGSLLPGRNYSSDSYRFGFNSQEKDDEVFWATGTSYTAEFWQYDSRIGRRWNIDPVDKPWQSRYHAFSNNPIAKIDPNGAKDDWVERNGEVIWDENVTSSTDTDLQAGDKYLGKSGTGFEDGMMTHYQGDGTKAQAPMQLREVEVVGAAPSLATMAYTRASNRLSKIWNTYEIGLIHVEASFELAIPTPDGTFGFGGSFGLVADAKNNLGFTMTRKELGGTSMGIAVGFNQSYVHRSMINQVTITDIQGSGKEYGLGLLGISGSTGWGTTGPGGSRILPSEGGYNSFGFGLLGGSLDVGFFNWNTETTVVPLFNGFTPLW
jgi:RHS repeat-associated protein